MRDFIEGDRLRDAFKNMLVSDGEALRADVGGSKAPLGDSGAGGSLRPRSVGLNGCCNFIMDLLLVFFSGDCDARLLLVDAALVDAGVDDDLFLLPFLFSLVKTFF